VASHLLRTKETAAWVNELRNSPVPIRVDERLGDSRAGFDSQPVKDFLAFIEPDKLNIVPTSPNSTAHFDRV
jgi:hypothetical protein